MEFITETLEDIRRTEAAHCKLCPEDDDDGVDVSHCDGWGCVLETLVDHAVEAHGLDPDVPWTDDYLEQHMEAT